MTVTATTTQQLGQRRTLVAVAVPAFAAVSVGASLNYLMDPLVEEVGLAADAVATALALPSLAGILVVFSAGALADRLGSRRVMVAAGCVFVLGCLLVAIAPGMAVVTGGLVLSGVGASALLIVALATVSARLEDPSARATAFSLFAALIPTAYLVMPFVAANLVEHLSWRAVPVLWLVLGVAGGVAALRLLPAEPATEGAGDLLSPLLLGVALAAAVQCVTWGSSDGATEPSTLLAGAVAVGAGCGAVITYRRARRPSLALGVAWRGAMPALLLILIVAQFANLWFYMLLAYRHAYDLTVLQTAFAMAPAQLAGLVGAAAARRLVVRRGVRRAGTILLVCLGCALLTAITLAAGSPLWQPIAVTSLFAAASVAASIPVTNAIMDSVPARHAGTASALNGAAVKIGVALGAAIMGGLVLGSVKDVLVDEIVAVVATAEDPAEVARRLEALSETPNPASDDPLLSDRIDQAQGAFARAMLTGIRLDGIVSAGIAFGSAGLFWVSLRRRREPRTA